MLDAEPSGRNCKVNRIEAIVDYFTSENSPGNRENISDKVVKYIDKVFSIMCRLTDLLMEKSGFCVYYRCSMGVR